MAENETVNLLVVEDEPDLREVLGEQLQGADVEIAGANFKLVVTLAENGRDAIRLFQTRHFDALLTDLTMPEMSGLELLAALRGEGCHIPSIVLTGFGDKSKAAEALRLGCFAFLIKPCQTSHLKKIVRAALERGVAQRSLHRKVEDRINVFNSVSDIRKRQLRTVFRSILIDDGSHRTDVCQIPDRKKSAS